MPQPLIIVILVIVVLILAGIIIFSWRNIRALVKPKLIPLDREMEFNKKSGLWLDFDSYDKKEYEVEGKDGYILHAMSVDNGDVRGTGKYIIISHGHTSSRLGAVKYLNSYIKLGFTCIIFDARNHGLNKPDICTLGNYESEDLLKVILDTRQRYKDIRVLGLHGESMGASASLIVTKFKPEIDFIVADCPNMGAYEVIHNCYSNVHLQFLAPLVWVGGKVFYGIDIKESDAYRDLDANTYPVLFIHGAGDTFIKPYHSEKLNEKAAKNGAYTELVMVENAGHARSRSVAGFENYTGYISSFLSKIGIE